MKAISLWQPWASAIALGLKKIETRSRMTLYSGELAICAAKYVSPDTEQIFKVLQARDCSLKYTFEQATAQTDPSIEHLPLGCVVAVVNLLEPVRTEMLNTISPLERMLGDYFYGRYGWILKDIRALREPVPVVGRQFLFNLPADVEAKVRAQL
jgi:hypothetical protein